MEPIDYVSHIDHDSVETFLNYEKIEKQEFNEINPLNYYYTLDSNWVHNELPVEVSRIRLGKNPYECEIKLSDNEADDIHVILQRTGNSWYIIESGKNELMKVNGVKQKQVILEHGDNVVIQIGEMLIIFSTASIKPKDSEEKIDSLEKTLNEGEYSIESNGVFVKSHYKRLCLIGSNLLCDLSVPGEKFAGMIANINKKLFIINLSTGQRQSLEADGIIIEDRAPLAPGSRINIGSDEIVFKLSKDLRFTKGQAFTEDLNDDKAEMHLVELDSEGHPHVIYVIPHASSSIAIGRDAKQCKIAILNSNNISRVHCQAIIYQKTIMLIDNGSTNGSFVNGEKIKKRMVRPGDMIKFGDLNFILCFSK